MFDNVVRLIVTVYQAGLLLLYRINNRLGVKIIGKVLIRSLACWHRMFLVLSKTG